MEKETGACILNTVLCDDKQLLESEAFYQLVSVGAMGGNEIVSMAAVKILINGVEKEISSVGVGLIDALFKAIKNATQSQSRLLYFGVKSLTSGTEAKADVLVELEEHGKKDWKPLQWLIQFAGLWTPTSRNLNVNANITPDTPAGTPTGAIDASCMKFIAIGYDLERYVDEIRASWSRLKSEGV